ncbi:UNVERIFIED_CONTAM: hypothetical protein ABIC26_005278, partial [Paenibacillus sp. PvR008]
LLGPCRSSDRIYFNSCNDIYITLIAKHEQFFDQSAPVK